MIEKDLFETYSAATIAFIEVCMEKKENIIICIFKRKLKKIYGKCQRMEAVLFFECTFKKHEHNSLTGQARKRCQNPVKNPFQKGSYFNQKSGVSSPTYLLTSSGPICLLCKKTVYQLFQLYSLPELKVQKFVFLLKVISTVA